MSTIETPDGLAIDRLIDELQAPDAATQPVATLESIMRYAADVIEALDTEVIGLRRRASHLAHEHTFLQVGGSTTADEVLDALNALGAEGWQASAVIDGPSGQKNVVLARRIAP